jgi:AraC family transcriptional regulator
MTLPGVGFHPMDLASCQTAVWRGLSGEVVRISTQESFECEYCGPLHLLIAYQQAARHTGDSTVEGLPRSRLHDLSRKLTFVPAGIRFQEQHDPSGPMHAIYLYIDPRGPLLDAEAGFAGAQLLPRLFFHRHFMWETALQFGALIEAGPSASQCYAEALGVVLAHKLMLLNSGKMLAAPAPVAQGGLADRRRRGSRPIHRSEPRSADLPGGAGRNGSVEPLSLLPSVRSPLECRPIIII